MSGGGFVSVVREDEMTEQEIQALIEASRTSDYEINFTPFQVLPHVAAQSGGIWTPRLEIPSLIVAQTGNGASKTIFFDPVRSETDTWFENSGGTETDYHFTVECEMWARGGSTATCLTGISLGSPDNPVGVNMSPASSQYAYAQLRVIGANANYSTGVTVQFVTNDGGTPTVPVTTGTVTMPIDPYFKFDWNPATSSLSAYVAKRGGAGWQLVGTKDITAMRATISGGSWTNLIGMFVTTGTDSGPEAFSAFFRNLKVRIFNYQGGAV